jgi:enamine deaminase RidA (YjgF/YER057c/UK114 family)
MTIQRHDTGPRMSKAVVHGDTVYLAGIVAEAPKGKSLGEQTKSILSQIDGFLAQAGTDKSKLLSANIWITDMAKFAEMMRCGTPGCRRATRRRAPPSRPSSPRPTMWSRSW